MARGFNGQARQQWQQRLARFGTSGLTVAAFCAAEGVSSASFYYWRKRLASSPNSETSPSTKPAFQSVRVLPTAAVLAIELPSGARIEVAADQLDLAGVVVREVTLASHVVLGGGE